VGVVAIVIGSALTRDSVLDLAAGVELAPAVADPLLAGITLVLCVPFVLGLLRNAAVIGTELAAAALPTAAEGAVDRGQAPRRVLAVALQLGAVAIAGLPLIAITGPFLPGWLGAPALAITLGVLGVFVWRSADSLQGHVRAGAEVVAELLRTRASSPGHLGADVQAVLPGLGEVDSLRVTEELPCCGRTLAEIDLRGRTGATVLAIDRADGPRIVPSASEPLQAGDLLALAGSREAVDRAIAVLSGTSGDDAGTPDAHE
jgi:CPA2 family monovalent cation:H+ antiporter-2